MNETERRRTILDAFDAVLDQPPETRERWLAERFPGDPAIAAAVEALIAADATPTILPTASGLGFVLIPPERVGTYRLIEPIGAGGMGEVWLGERADGLFDHRVAIKLMRPSLVSPELEAFFDSERRLLARLRHPHIARLFDGGVTEQGIGWFAMDLVEGLPLDAWAAGLPPGATPRADIVRRVAMAAAVCEAVQHAHQHLIVHADLKPQNILVEDGDVPRLVDFGIAHLVAADDPAVQRAYPRTPAYASPERLAGAAPSVADDVFALGTLLSGLLTGRWAEDPQMVPPPSLAAPAWLAGTVRGDLDAIVTCARAPDPAERYATAEALAADLRAWLEHRPVSARGGAWRYVAKRFVRRNRLAVVLAGTALAALVVTVVIVTSLYVRAEVARREADQRFADVRGLAHYMMVDFHDALEPLAGASPLRARTAEVGRWYLERLSKSRGDDTSLTRELGIGYGRVGHTLAVTATNGARGMEAGDRALAKAEALLEAVVRAQPTDAAAKVELARVLTWRSSVVAYSRSDSAGAHRLLDRAFALDDAVLRHAPGDMDAEYGRWLAVLGRLDVWQQEQRWQEIAALAAKQQARADRLVVPRAQAALRPLLEAAQQNAWGDALDWLGRPRAALTHYAQAYLLLDRQLPRAASDVRVRTRMIGYAYQLSTVYDEVGDKRSALAWAERGVAAARTLSQFERSPAAAGMANLVTLQHASLLVDTGHADAAVAEARASVEERRRSALAEPTSDDARSSYLFALRVLVELYDRAKRPADACASARTAQTGWAVLYRGRTPPEKQAGDIKRIAAKVAGCTSAH